MNIYIYTYIYTMYTYYIHIQCIQYTDVYSTQTTRLKTAKYLRFATETGVVACLPLPPAVLTDGDREREILGFDHAQNQDFRRRGCLANNWGRLGYLTWPVGGLEHEIYDFPYIGNFIIPTDELIFFRGVGQPPTRFGATWTKKNRKRWCNVLEHAIPWDD